MHADLPRLSVPWRIYKRWTDIPAIELSLYGFLSLYAYNILATYGIADTHTRLAQQRDLHLSHRQNAIGEVFKAVQSLARYRNQPDKQPYRY